MPDRVRKVALVTGSATGVGRACVLRFAQRGMDVVVNYTRSEAEAHETAREAERREARSLVCQCDVADDGAVRRMVEQVRERFGRLDVLVNNAGTTYFIDHKDLEALTEARWDRILGVNLKGAFFCARAAAPLMRAVGGGAIVNVSSCAGISGAGSSIAYAASKGGMNTMTKSLARAMAPEIRVNAVCPGPIDTRWLAGHEDMVARSLAVTPLGRASSADDITDTVTYLALDTAMTTGQCLVVDGGRTM
ncbi:MAG: SDR family oxidoreductase [Planctomycetes bacterium]|nr:SDR family oxidoreductase [Planctomycetota bacterium]